MNGIQKMREFFGDATLFDEKMQQIADNRLIYKILVASARGNVKIPPLKNRSRLFRAILQYSFQKNGNRFLKTERYAAMKNCRIC